MRLGSEGVKENIGGESHGETLRRTRGEEKKSIGECVAAKVLRNFGLSAVQGVVKAAASRRTSKQGRGGKDF